MKTLIKLLLILILASSYGFAQDKTIKGKVTSPEGDPLVGVTILVKGTAIGTFSKSDGTYEIKVPENAKTLIFRFVGRVTKEVAIGDENVINVTLAEDKVLMDEVVVTAIGLERQKKSLGYAVEEVKGRTLHEAKTTSMIDALSGKVAGVKVNSSAGTPGASSFINIRGMSSITGNNQPLFVVDGIPIDNSMAFTGNPDDGANNLLYGVAYSNRAIDINSEDIESVTVLKGPAATALYGLRASSGAVVITTKKGAAAIGDRVNVNYSSSVEFQDVSLMPEMQDKYAQGMPGAEWVPLGTNWPSISWGLPIEDLRYTNQESKWDKNGTITHKDSANATNRVVNAYDNVGNFFELGQTFRNSLSMSGGTDIGSYFFSVSDLRSTGIVPNSDFTRTTLKIAGEAKISNRLKASGSVNYINSGGQRIQQGSNVSGVMLGLLRTPPNFDNSNGYGEEGDEHKDAYMFEDGTQRSYRGGTGYDNPFWTVNRNILQDNVERLLGFAKLDYYVADWMSIMYRLGGDIYTDTRKQHFAIYSNSFPSGQVAEHDITNGDITSNLLLNFSYQLTEDLSAKLLLGNELFETHYTTLYVQGDQMALPEFYHLSNTKGQITRESDEKLRRIGYYGDLTLDYKGWLYLNGVLRNEKSTTLPEDNNSFLYGSSNLSFVFTEAFDNVFTDDLPITFGKLRLNYAVVGKDAPLYSTRTPFIQGTYADGWTTGISFPYKGYVGYAKGDVLGNADLKPEKTTSWEIGLDMNFLENRVGFGVTYYESKSVDQIFNVPIAYTAGYWRQVMNAGELKNKGFEAVLNGTPIIGDFRWDIRFNFATNENTVVKLAEGVENIFLGGFQGSSVRAVAGKPYGTIFGFGWLRDDNGNVIIDDDPGSSNYGYPILDPIEKDFGNANPDWTMGISNSISWKGLSLSFLFDIKSGGVMWNGTKGALYFFGTHKDTEARNTTKVFKGVKGHLDDEGNLVHYQGDNEVAGSGTQNDIEADYGFNWLAFGNGNGFFGSNTEDFIEDAGWIRLREISLSYQLPVMITDYTPFSDIILTLTGRNLWIDTDYTGIDPETNLMGAYNAQGIDYFNMPGTRTYVVSLDVRF